MPDNNKNYARPPVCAAERWARALGLSKERLAAIVKEVVEERQVVLSRQDLRAVPAARRRQT